uniref:Uncharacterized protein n=1 Tax=Romanomermis culicivorax TaxID=13658 RepID=A0A915KLL0_ROMCU
MIDDEKSFDDVWPEIFATLQHLCWILNLRPSPSTGLLEPPSSDATTSNRSPTMIRASINTLPAMNYVAQIAFSISGLMKKTNELPAESVHLIIDALLNLSDDCQKVHQEGRDPSYFSICKFVELIIANLSRSDAFIQKVINQLYKLSSQPYQLLREVSISALISITSTIIVESGSSSLFTS